MNADNDAATEAERNMKTPEAVLDAAKLAMQWDGYIAPEDTPAFVAWRLLAEWVLHQDKTARVKATTPKQRGVPHGTVADLQEAVRVLLRDAVPGAAHVMESGQHIVEMYPHEWDKLVAATKQATDTMAKLRRLQ